MKSIVQEASSIQKAINKAWEEAGRPLEFSVRILEHPSRNFFGFLKRSAKVALVFPSVTKKQEPTRDRKNQRDERTHKETRTETKKPEVKRNEISLRSIKPSSPEQNRAGTKTQEPKNKRRAEQPAKQQESSSELSKALAKESIEKQTKPTNKPAQSHDTQAKEPKKEISLNDQAWEPELVTKINEQVQAILENMGKKEHSYTTTVQGRELLINFSGLILQTEDQDRRLFSGLSPLLMTMIKREFKKALRGYRIVLGHDK